MPRKAMAAALIIFCLAGGGAYLYSRGKAGPPPSHPAVADSGTPRSAPAPNAPAEDETLKPIATDASGGAAADSDTSLAARNAGAPLRKQASGQAPPQETGAKTSSQKQTRAAGNAPAEPGPAPQAEAPQPPSKPAASAAELEEAHQRFIRLRSKALALKNSLAELRMRLASQGLSVNADAVEAEGNMDSYMLEADRALQANDAQTAQTNMDKAEHEAKKISALFGR